MNEEFLERIKSYIPDEFDGFLASLDKTFVSRFTC